MIDVIARSYSSDDWVDSLRDAFLEIGYVKLPKVLHGEGLAVLAGSLERLFSRATRRSFFMPGSQTLRRMSTIGGRRLAAEAPKLVSLYSNEDVLSLVRRVTGSDIYRCQHEHEFMVANYLSQQNDSHGWHLDDPAYALVLIVEAPSAEDGGCLEFIPGWEDLCREWGVDPWNDVLPTVERARGQGLVEVRHHAPGDGYLLKASTVLHCVAPLTTAGAKRIVLNVAYQNVRRQTYGYTATALYGER